MYYDKSVENLHKAACGPPNKTQATGSLDYRVLWCEVISVSSWWCVRDLKWVFFRMGITVSFECLWYVTRCSAAVDDNGFWTVSGDSFRRSFWSIVGWSWDLKWCHLDWTEGQKYSNRFCLIPLIFRGFGSTQTSIYIIFFSHDLFYLQYSLILIFCTISYFTVCI